jgi:4-amino-4-deoxy-L-arabinose transferase-like glycosyltransferase
MNKVSPASYPISYLKNLVQKTQQYSRSPQFVLAGLLVFAFLLMWAYYVGFQAADDKSYLNGALGWVNSFPFVGKDHWALRHPMTIPAAISIKFFGLNEFGVSLPNIIYFTFFIVLNYWAVRKYLGTFCAAITTLIFITLPGFIILSTYLEIGIPEIFYLSVSFWSFRKALDFPEKTRLWLISGAAMGLAFVTRETAASFVVFIGLVFLFKPIVSRLYYIYLFGAAASILFIDWLYLALMTGNVRYRYSIDLNHDTIDRFAVASRVAVRKGLIDNEGNISVNVFIDPVLNLFVSQKYTLIFWLLVPALFLLWRKRTQLSTSLTLGLLTGYVFVSFLFLGANPKLYLVPRYFLVTAWAASIIVAWWLVSLFRSKKYLSVAVAVLALFGANFVAMSVENINPRFVEKTLLAYSTSHPNEVIYTDTETIEKAKFYFRFANKSMDSVSPEIPPQGATFFYSAERIATCKLQSKCRERFSEPIPGPTWSVKEEINPTPRLLGKLIRLIGVDKSLPLDIKRKLLLEGGNVTIYTVAKP